MEIETKTATGKVLNWLVAKCVGVTSFDKWHAAYLWPNGEDKYPSIIFEPTSNWEQGGPIVEKMMRERGLLIEALDAHYAKTLPAFKATFDGGETVYRADTWLTAGLLAFVASVKGEHVEVPDELLL